MTYGVSRMELQRLADAYARVRPEILRESRSIHRARFEPGAYVVGVHYRGTDATHNWSGRLTHYRTERVPYRAYADEVRRVLEVASPRVYQVFVATDEIECLEFMCREFGDRRGRATTPRHECTPAARRSISIGRLPVSDIRRESPRLSTVWCSRATSYLVKGRSNLSDASLVFNPQLPYSFCPDVTPSLAAR